MEDSRYHRQMLLFGKEGQVKIEQIKVGIVGLGGLGSHIAQGLAYLGVKNYTLVDSDSVDTSNLNRLIGAYQKDANAKRLKVDVAKKLVRHIQPNAQVQKIGDNLRSQKALKSLTNCSVIFGCVDNDAARLILDELSAAYLIPMIDLATEIYPSEGLYGGRVVMTKPGKFCLSCAGEIDFEQAKQELEDEQTHNVRQQHGYGIGEKVQAPAVVSLNGVIANLALTEFMVMVTGLRSPNQYIHYPAERNEDNRPVIKSRSFLPNADCYTCGYVAGKGDAINIYRYMLASEKHKKA